MTRRLVLEPLTQDAFAPFGDVIDAPARGERPSLEQTIGGSDGATQPKLAFSHVEPWALPIQATQMERHNRSSQCFAPMDVARWVVMVAPDLDGKPDEAGLRAFLARGDQAVNYHTSAWHHPVRVLDRPGRFAVLMWTTGTTADDEEWATLAEPVSIEAG
jgi:ureidoglycolate lyase